MWPITALNRRVKSYFDEWHRRNQNMVRYVFAGGRCEQSGDTLGAMLCYARAGFYSSAAEMAEKKGMPEEAERYRALKTREDMRRRRDNKRERRMWELQRFLWDLGYY